MTGGSPGIVVALALAGPAVALAAGGAGARSLVIDFERSGLRKDLLAKTLGVAKSLLFLLAFIAYALEAFGRAPASERDYGTVTWRLVTVLFLLWNYQPIFGSVIGLMDLLEGRAEVDLGEIQGTGDGHAGVARRPGEPWREARGRKYPGRHRGVRDVATGGQPVTEPAGLSGEGKEASRAR